MAESSVPSSFIPQDTGDTSSLRRREGGGLNELLLLSVIVLFVASAALAVGVFLYQQYLAAESSSKLAQLERAKAAFEPSLIRELTRLDDRMHAADRILAAHAAPTAFFQALQQATLTTVSFQTLSLEALDPQHISIKMAGTARSVNSIALQADIFSKNGVISGPIFSNIAREVNGVHFNLVAAVNPTSINYASMIHNTQVTQGQNQTAPQDSAQPGNPSPFAPPDAASSSVPQQ